MNKRLEVCGGCNAKIGIEKLNNILADLDLRTNDNPNLLLSFSNSDDAAIYQISETEAIVQTLDFFPPPVEDPFTFGQIAACNALSDIYAMGARPITALNIVAWPEKEDINILREILAGGASIIKLSGASLCGGHSIHDPRIKYGLAVTGISEIKKLKRNDTGEDGDVLILTKPLGIGLLTGKLLSLGLDKETKLELIETMTCLNKDASEVAIKYNAHAMTDVTGFSLIGHLKEMLSDRLNAKIHLRSLPILEGAIEASKEKLITAGGVKNKKFLEKYCDFRHSSEYMKEIIFDPQTSGGLLIACDEKVGEKIVQELKFLGHKVAIIGELFARNKTVKNREENISEKRIFIK